MENNIKLEKEYKIPYDVFKNAYTVFQKKNVYPKNYLFMGLFIVIAAVYVAAAVEDPTNKIAYVLICVCLALAAREWYNPRKIKRTLLETIKTENLEDETYKIQVADEYIDISTLPRENVENFATEVPDEEYEEEPLPEASRIPINGELSISEHDEFFLMYIKKKMFYVIPKEAFSESELEVIRCIGQND